MSDRNRLTEIVCLYRDQVPSLMALLLFFGILLSMSLLSLNPGTASFTIALVDAILVVVGFIIFGGIYWFCPKREYDE